MKNLLPDKVLIIAGIVLAVLLIGIGAVYFYLHDPTTVTWYPKCTTYQLTGLLCPGCGITRAAYNAIHGNIVRSLQCNALAYLTVIWLAILIYSKKYTLHLSISYAVIVIAYTVLRNLDTPVSFALRP